MSIICRTLASLIVKQANIMGLTGGEYMWIMSSIVLCKCMMNRLIEHVSVCCLATYSSEAEPKMNPYDNPNRRKIEFLPGTLGLCS